MRIFQWITWFEFGTMDHAIVVCGVAPAKLIQIAKRRLMIKQAPVFGSSSSSNDTTLRILERSIQALDRLIRICNNSNGNTNNQSGSGGGGGGGGSNTLRFNHAQCRFLDLQGFHDNLRNLLDEVASLDGSRREQCCAAAVEIARVTSNAEALVANWAPEAELFEEWSELQDSWMIRGMVCAADGGLAAAQQNHEQQWCISVLEVVMAQFRADRDDASKHAIANGSTKKKQNHVPYWMIDRTFEIAEESLVLDEDRSLEQATRLDRRRLLDKLRKMRQRNEGFFRGLSSMLFRASSSKNKSSSRRQELVSYLMSKLDADDEGESRIESYIERIHQSEAWADSYATISSSNSNELILGRGCFASVQRSEFLGFPAALKTAPACSRDDFWNEVAVLAGMQHPRLAQLLFASIDEEATVCRLWTELLGSDLDAVLRQEEKQQEDGGGEIGLLVAVEIMLQIAEGMAYLHKKGILHRHLKASNVLLVPPAAAASNKMRSLMRKRKKGMSSSNNHGLDEFVRVKITDYGLPKTKLAGSSAASSSIRPRLRFWQAPEAFEQTSPRPQFTRRSDVYSFGMLCYHILSSKRPFSGCSDEEELFRMVCIDRARPELPRHCPPYLAALIHRCWSHEPELRPSFAQICCFLKSSKALLIRSPLQQQHQHQHQKLLLPFTPSDFGNLRKHLGLGFFVDAIAMLKHQQEVLLDQGLLDSWPFPMDAFVLWLGSSVEQLENEEGFGAAAEMAGDFLADWTGPRHEFEQAVFWYYKASSSSSSSASARWKLAMCVELGLGLARDEKRAFGLYKQAAREGFLSAHVELGRCYQTGKGVTRNADKAVAHFAKALELFDDNSSIGDPSSSSSSLECVEFLMRMLARAAAEEDCVWAAERIQEIAARSRSGRMIVAGRGCCNVRELVGMLGDCRVKEVGRRKAKMVLERLAVEEDILQQALLG